ncbi:MAG: mannose-1-phosphate guanylyltransferase/mannose-6-phosphate isomerase [Gammaproteobacteria bacterium]|nr:mannose-1-phosphate guanylyltransferase/mannose-6-phosphate isomerase [Gammaproteobacteria bacterium]
MQLIPVILCGGSGTRLWPMSRQMFPKQLLALTNEFTLLQNTINRVKGLQCGSKIKADPSKALFVSNEEHRFLIAQQLQDIGIAGAKIVLEPAGRNTAPALTAAAQIILKQDDALMLVMPADHIIPNVQRFHEAVCRAAELAIQDQLVTFGIVATRPETGYGYIERGEGVDGDPHYPIKRFVEKPDLDTAKQYLDSGNFYWNSGMFLMKASIWQQAIAQFNPDIARNCQAAVDNAQSDMDFVRLNKSAFCDSPSDSIDYAVMEKLATDSAHQFKGAVVALDAGWSDIGAWDSLWDVSDKQASGNVFKGDVIADSTENSMVLADHRLVTTVGLKNMIVVETADAVLVADMNNAQNVKNIVNQIKERKRTEADIHRNVFRPWGSYQGIDVGERFQVKRIVVKPGAALSLQMHHHRAEHWIVVKGTARVTRGDEVTLLSENQSTYIPIGVTHRLENPGTIPLEIIEVQSGSYLGEDDIVRFEDQYGRKQ